MMNTLRKLQMMHLESLYYVPDFQLNLDKHIFH